MADGWNIAFQMLMERHSREWILIELTSGNPARVLDARRILQN